MDIFPQSPRTVLYRKDVITGLIGGPPRIPGLVGLHELNHKGAAYARHRLDYPR